VIAYADGSDSPRTAPHVIAGLAGVPDMDVLLGWTPEPRDWLASPDLRGRTILAGYALAQAVAERRLQYLPVRLSAIPRLVTGALRPEVAVVTGVPRGDHLAFSTSAGWGPAICRAARRGVVVEIDPEGVDLGGPLIPDRILATVPRPPRLGPSVTPRPPDELDLAIGRRVVANLPDEPTMQLGLGVVADAILAMIDRPVHIFSGLLTDAAARLDEKDLLLSPATAAYAWGGRPVFELAQRGQLRLLPVEETHDLTRLSAIDRLVGCNTALQVGLDGSVNVERVGGRYVAGIGGHADFCAGAARSKGGISVVALRSTTRGGASTIVPQVDVVSTPRCDVDMVVTEHGVADLRGVDDETRARRMATIAAPAHRDRLEQFRP
jgi:acyl-CoA hydrolase